MARRSGISMAPPEDMDDGGQHFEDFVSPQEAASLNEREAENKPEEDSKEVSYTVTVNKIPWSRPQGSGTRYILKGYVEELKKEVSIFCTTDSEIEVNDKLTVFGELSSETNNRGYKEEKIEANIVQHKIVETSQSIQTWLTKHIRDIGPATAQRIVEQLGGGRALSKFENVEEMVRLGVKQSLAEDIHKQYKENASAAKNYMFLVGVVDRHNKPILNKAQIRNILESIPPAALKETLQENPWRIASINRIGFETADTFGKALGFKWECPERVHAGCVFALNQVGQNPSMGYTAVPEDTMIEVASSEKVLGVEKSLIKNMLTEMVENKTIVKDEKTGYLYTPEMWDAEENIVNRVLGVLSKPPYVSKEVAYEIMAECSKFEGVKLDPSQEAAVIKGIMYPMLVITGGPGTGKSTVQKVLFRALASPKSRRTDDLADDMAHEEDFSIISPSCPTGKGAVRLAEASGFSASTIHRQLEYSVRDQGFRRNKYNKIPAAVIATDEYSMTDTLLCSSQMSAISDKSSFLIIGDDDQLTSVGAGQVLRDLIDSGIVPVSKLTNTHRQAKGSGIPIVANRILNGVYPFKENETLRGCTHINVEDALGMEEILKIVSDDMVAQGLSPDTDIIVMSPMRKGKLGVTALNTSVKTMVNPKTNDNTTQEFKNIELTLHDLVMNIENNPDIGVMNGDVGNVVGFTTVSEINSKGEETGKMLPTPIIDFNGRHITFPPDKISNLVHNDASTVHKQQGSENTIAVIVLPKEASHMTSKNLLFTGLTRAKGQAYIVGSAESLMKCINNVSATNRITGLKNKLKDRIPEIRAKLTKMGAPTDFLEENMALIEERQRHIDEVNARAATGKRAPEWAIRQTRCQRSASVVARPLPPTIRRGGPRRIAGIPTPPTTNKNTPPSDTTQQREVTTSPASAPRPVFRRPIARPTPAVGTAPPKPASPVSPPSQTQPRQPSVVATPRRVVSVRPMRPTPVMSTSTQSSPSTSQTTKPEAPAPETKNADSPQKPSASVEETRIDPIRNPPPVRRPPVIRRVVSPPIRPGATMKP